MHSSRMRTARSLTASRSMHRGSVHAEGRACVPGGSRGCLGEVLHAQGVVPAWGCACHAGPPPWTEFLTDTTVVGSKKRSKQEGICPQVQFAGGGGGGRGRRTEESCTIKSKLKILNMS